jgi:lipopolysaccharide transport system ATP-binding protein
MNLTNEPAIAVRHLSKKYYLGSENYNIVGETFANLVSSPLRKLIGKSPKAAGRKRQMIWALQAINFNIARGERVGIIGKNGAGKSTLLKILSRLVYPSEGEAVIRGRVTSLLEVGTGFNPNLSGRENIFLNASLHGLQHHEISAIFDDVVNFSEIEKFIDTPVRHYSSGMYMRLAFAVAAHLDPDILLLDEVLAVGDMSFQQKCLQRVEGLTSEGRTVLFVSHSMDAVARFCDRCIWLEQGKIVEDGTTEAVISSYVEKKMGIQSQQQWVADESVKISSEDRPSEPKLSNLDRPQKSPTANLYENEYFRLVAARVINSQRVAVTTVPVYEPLAIEIVYDIFNASKNVQPALYFKTNKDVVAFVVAYTDPHYLHGVPEIGRYTATVWIPPNLLNVGLMHVTVAMATPDPLERYVQIERAISFNVHEIEGVSNTARGLYARDFPGVVRPLLTWETKYVEAATNVRQELI